jgi:hypothetical protein
VRRRVPSLVGVRRWDHLVRHEERRRGLAARQAVKFDVSWFRSLETLSSGPTTLSPRYWVQSLKAQSLALARRRCINVAQRLLYKLAPLTSPTHKRRVQLLASSPRTRRFRAAAVDERRLRFVTPLRLPVSTGATTISNGNL